MDTNQNTGSFMAPTGTSADPIQQALARRGGGQGGAPATAQSSQAQMPMPESIPQDAGVGAPQPAQAPGALPPKPSETELIIKILGDRIKTFSKIEESQFTSSTPPIQGDI